MKSAICRGTAIDKPGKSWASWQRKSKCVAKFGFYPYFRVKVDIKKRYRKRHDCIICGICYGCGGRARYAFLHLAKIAVATSVCTGGSNTPPGCCAAMGSSPAPYDQRKEKSHPGWDDFSFSGTSYRFRYRCEAIR